MKKRIFFGLVLLGVLSSAAGARLGTETVQGFELPNHLRLYVKEDHRAPVVFSSIWYRVGSADEPNGITGISHMLEHMMFRGTARYPAGSFDRLIASVGGQQNAETTQDYTMFYQLIPKTALAQSFALEADRMRGLIWQDDVFAKEKQVVIEERRMRFENNPQALAYERFAAAAFVSSPYHHQAIGWMSDLQQLRTQDAKAWYDQWYHPNNAILVVVGDVKPNDVFELAKKAFGQLPAKTLPARKAHPSLTALGPTELRLALKHSSPMVILGFLAPSLTNLNPAARRDVYALDALAYLLAGARSSRLENHLVREQGLASYVSGDFSPFSRYSSLWQLSAIPSANTNVETLAKSLMTALQRVAQEPITTDELARVKAQLLADQIFQSDSLSAQASLIGAALVRGLAWQMALDYPKAINRLTPADLTQAAKRYLQAPLRTQLILQGR